MAIRIGEAGYGRRRCPELAPSSRSAACCTRAGPRLRPPAAARRGSTSTGGGPAPARDRRPRGQLRRARRGPGARCSSTASAPPGRTGWRTCRSSRATTAWWRWTCPASATRRCRASDISIECYARWIAELMRRARDRSARGRRQLDGRLHRRRARDPASRRACSGSCSSPPPIFWQDRRARAAAGAARAAVRRRRRPARSCAPPTTIATRPRLRAAPRSPAPASATRSCSPRARATSWCAARGGPTASCPRWRRWPTTRSTRSCPKIELPDADRLGRARHARARSRTPSGCEEPDPGLARARSSSAPATWRCSSGRSASTALLREFLAETPSSATARPLSASA